jgi:Protein of unknown function (DUF3617)
MKRTLQTAAIAACVCAALTAAPRAAAAIDHPNITPGSWELSMKIEVDGRPSMPEGMPATTIKQCIKPEQVQNNKSFADLMNKRGGKCEYTDFKTEGNKISYSFACQDGPSGTSEVVFGGTTYEVTTHAITPPHGNHPAMKMTQHLSGKRLGDC